jgi:lysophospholipase L1-like esterase
VLIGDVFVSGIDTYGELNSNRLVCGETWTIGKASDAISKIKESNANKVFIELGLNDLNNGRSASKAYELYEEFVADIKNVLPNAQIYVVSLFPVTTGFESKDSTTIKNTTVSELNDMLSGMEGVTFLNVNNSIANSDGSLNADISDSGYNIKPSYYGFILNLIAEMCQ